MASNTYIQRMVKLEGLLLFFITVQVKSMRDEFSETETLKSFYCAFISK
jgi:hypothetical protein